MLLAVVSCWLAIGLPATAKDGLNSGGLDFRDFGIADNGASFGKADPISGGGPNQIPSRVVSIDAGRGLARIRFDSIRVGISLPLGWQATEDWERGVGYSSDRRYRVIVWRVDFTFEGVTDAEHYAATKSGAIKARRPGTQARARKLADGSYLIVYENVRPDQGDSEARTVFDAVIPKPGNPKEGILLTLGVPAPDAERGLKLMALLKSSLEIDW